MWAPPLGGGGGGATAARPHQRRPMVGLQRLAAWPGAMAAGGPPRRRPAAAAAAAAAADPDRDRAWLLDDAALSARLPRLPSTSAVYAALADRVMLAAGAAGVLPPPGDENNTGGGRRWVVGIAGAPGAGKSTLARRLVGALNRRWGRPRGVAVAVPMDGFHLTRAQLDAAPDPAAAHARRGAPWTFDGAGYVACLRAARAGGRLAAPSFDHGAGDPAPGDIAVEPWHRVVVSEGNYLLLDEAPWAELVDGGVLDDSWYVDTALDEAGARVLARHVACGRPPAEAARRVRDNDRPNAERVAASRGRARVLVPRLPLPFDDAAGSTLQA